MHGVVSEAVPARVGGVDLSTVIDSDGEARNVPARVGGVDLSDVRRREGDHAQSPPVWAGWI